MPKIRVLIVDDAVVMRRLISEALARNPHIEVVGTAAHGRIALAKIAQVNPDVITLDVEMPEMDGLQTIREIRKIYPKLPVIMFSTLTERGAAKTLEALAAGATDYVTKPANVGNLTLCLERLEEDLATKIKLHYGQLHLPAAANPALPKSLFAGTPPVSSRPPTPVSTKPVELVCIGTSTGGPNALAEIFSALPAKLAAPVVIVQHMPPLFTKMLAERLDRIGPVRFLEGAEGVLLEPGHGYIAPGGHHMEVIASPGGLRIKLNEQPPENSCRPAVDVLFRSVAACNVNTLAVVLTGMGQDGLHGCRHLREHHAQILVQDEKTSVVWGMPGHVAQAGLSDRILALGEFAPEIYRRVSASRSSSSIRQPLLS